VKVLCVEEKCYLLILFFSSLGRCFVEAFESNHETDYEMQLVEKMMKNYKARVEVRPVARSNQPVIVSFDLAYSQLIDLVKPFLVCFSARILVPFKRSNRKPTRVEDIQRPNLGNLTLDIIKRQFFTMLCVYLRWKESVQNLKSFLEFFSKLLCFSFVL
jgi:hypothetical protein